MCFALTIVPIWDLVVEVVVLPKKQRLALIAKTANSKYSYRVILKSIEYLTYKFTSEKKIYLEKL
jgi:hypothetical protein